MQTFKKKERLTEKKIIQNLFEKGNEFFISPFRVIWNCLPSDKSFTVKILIAVSGKNFKKAVDRNRIRRLVRESYRKNKYILYNAFPGRNENFIFILNYTGKTILTYKEIEAKIILILQRLTKEYEALTR